MKQNQKVNNCEKELSFNIDKAFFIIDSNNLSNTKEKLYGYVFQDDEFIFDAEKLKSLQKPISELGVYIYIKKEDDTIKIYQDYNGSYGLYLYKENDYFAISNSFMYLLDYIKKNHKISFNKAYSDVLLSSGTGTRTYGETLINEIKQLDRSTILTIDMKTKDISIQYKDYKERTVDINSKEALEILDNWYLKYTGLIRKLYKDGKNILVDLSGGYDSRMTFSLFVGANIDLNKIFVKSPDSDFHTFREDYNIAKKIGEYYGFELNKNEALKFDKIHKNSYTETFNLIFSFLGGFGKTIYYLTSIKSPYSYRFTGYGGECIRPYWSTIKEQVIQEEASKAYKVCNDRNMFEDAKEIMLRTYNSIKKKYETFERVIDEDKINEHLFRETYAANHFGKYSAALFQSGEITPNPLLDSGIAKLRLCDENCKDSNLLMALILTRYAKDLLKIEYCKGKTIADSTLEYAKQLNEKYPFKNPNYERLTRDVNGSSQLDINVYENPDTTEDLNEYVKKVFFSTRLRKIFETKYSCKKLYENISTALLKGKGLGGLGRISAVIPITKVISDVLANDIMQRTSYFDFLEDEIQYFSEENKIPLTPVKKKTAKKEWKPNTLQKIFSVTNLYKKKEKHKRIMILGIKITI